MNKCLCAGSDHAKLPQLRQFSPMEVCFLVLTLIFSVKLAAVSFTRFSQRIRSIHLLKVTMQRFGSQLGFDLLDES